MPCDRHNPLITRLRFSQLRYRVMSQIVKAQPAAVGLLTFRKIGRMVGTRHRTDLLSPLRRAMVSFPLWCSATIRNFALAQFSTIIICLPLVLIVANAMPQFMGYSQLKQSSLKKFWHLPPVQKAKRCREVLQNRLGHSLARNSAAGTKTTASWAGIYWPGRTFIPAKFGGKITVFKRRKQPFFYVRDPFLGWGSRITGDVELHVIDPFPQNICFYFASHTYLSSLQT